MRFFIILAIFISIHVISDYYIFQVVKSVYKETFFIIYFKWMVVFFSIVTIIAVLGIFFSIGGSVKRSFLVNILIGASFAYLAAKLLTVSFFFLVEVVRFLEWVLQLFHSQSLTNVGRRKFLINVGLVLGAAPLFSLIYGVIANRYNYKVRKLLLSFTDLPKTFNGYKIIQISDIHSGSFDNEKAVKKGIEMINAQKPDLVVFTGDLVNNHPNEIDPYLHIFREIKAKDGVMSVTGNHDYHFLYRNSGESFSLLVEKHQQLNYRMLNNEHVRIERGNDSIVIAGVENWGLPPFPQRGDLDKALKNLQENDFVVLLSHDPSHWDAQILKHPQHVHLTLSGHTHGMQFGVDLPRFKWSPVKWKYPQWIDLYNHENQQLYVNRGFGFIGYPGRVGVLPEIALFELKQS